MSIDFGADGPKQTAVVIQVLILLTVLSLAPALFIMVTSFTRIVIVLAFLRQALGTQTTPSNQVLIGLALFLTIAITQPVAMDIYNNAWMWPKIWQGNRDQIKDPDVIHPTQKLKIPQAGPLTADEKRAANRYYSRKQH